MLYLIGQIVLCLMFTALIGVAVGWLLRGLGSARQTDLVEARWRARLVQLQQQKDASATVPAPAAAAPPEQAAELSESAQTEALRQQLAERERELASLRTAQAVRKQHPETDLEQPLRESQALCQQLQGHLADQRAANDQMTRQLELAQTERETLIMRLRDNESAIGKLTKERQHAIATVASLQKELRSLRSAVARGAATVPQPTSAGDAARAQPTPASPASPPAPAASPDVQPTVAAAQDGTATAATAIAASATTGPVQRARTERSDGGPEDYQPHWRLPRPQGQADDLQAIYGIGPKLQRQLNDLGVFHFQQIAGFGRRDILWVAQRLKAFPGRILRDRWVEQARSLAARGGNEPV